MPDANAWVVMFRCDGIDEPDSVHLTAEGADEQIAALAKAHKLISNFENGEAWDGPEYETGAWKTSVRLVAPEP